MDDAYAGPSVSSRKRSQNAAFDMKQFCLDLDILADLLHKSPLDFDNKTPIVDRIRSPDIQTSKRILNYPECRAVVEGLLFYCAKVPVCEVVHLYEYKQLISDESLTLVGPNQCPTSWCKNWQYVIRTLKDTGSDRGQALALKEGPYRKSYAQMLGRTCAKYENHNHKKRRFGRVIAFILSRFYKARGICVMPTSVEVACNLFEEDYGDKFNNLDLCLPLDEEFYQQNGVTQATFINAAPSSYFAIDVGRNESLSGQPEERRSNEIDDLTWYFDAREEMSNKKARLVIVQQKIDEAKSKLESNTLEYRQLEQDISITFNRMSHIEKQLEMGKIHMDNYDAEVSFQTIDEYIQEKESLVPRVTAIPEIKDDDSTPGSIHSYTESNEDDATCLSTSPLENKENNN